MELHWQLAQVNTCRRAGGGRGEASPSCARETGAGGQSSCFRGFAGVEQQGARRRREDRIIERRPETQ